jgi:hypothetical protein
LIFCDPYQAVPGLRFARELGFDDVPMVSFGFRDQGTVQRGSPMIIVDCDLVHEGYRAYGLYQSAQNAEPPQTLEMEWSWPAEPDPVSVA